MNRKLHHTVMALSATATVFTVLLLAGSPVPPPLQSAPQLMLSGDVAGAEIDTVLSVDMPQVSASQRRHQRHSRALLALPYFSFAQGLRRNRS